MSGGPHMTMEQVVRTFKPCKLYDGVNEKIVSVEVDGEMEEVEIDPQEGPKILKPDGTGPGPNDFHKLPRVCRSHLDMSAANGLSKGWIFYTSTERKMCVLQAAKINKQRRALAAQRSVE
ncbi:unnamed protein product [Symbiodinium pilosum]|uniref:Uncharacterized protein n=1 Tax=Symbiodinium pilosum TaxID=2952 RepID=A0A812XEG6_SYMPI|nr:unnamed protein product [Symbiodinium pilosum]